MKALNLLFLCSLIGVVGCSKNDSLFNTVEILDDFSYIEDPKERWQAYRLSDYSITQSRYCECAEPYEWTNLVIENELSDVEYEMKEEGFYVNTEEEIYTYLLSGTAITVEEAFQLIEDNLETSGSIRVEYDSRFGFPTLILIDHIPAMADEETIYRFRDLKAIEK